MDPDDSFTPEVMQVLAQRIDPHEGERAVDLPGRPSVIATTYEEAKRDRLSRRKRATEKLTH